MNDYITEEDVKEARKRRKDRKIKQYLQEWKDNHSDEEVTDL